MNSKNNFVVILLILIIVLGIAFWIKYEKDLESMPHHPIETRQEPVTKVVPKEDYVLIQDRFDQETILNLVDEHYEFYRRDYVYREPLVKKVNDFRYHISVEECQNNEIALKYNLWHSHVMVLLIHMDGSYTLK